MVKIILDKDTLKIYLYKVEKDRNMYNWNNDNELSIT